MLNITTQNPATLRPRGAISPMEDGKHSDMHQIAIRGGPRLWRPRDREGLPRRFPKNSGSLSPVPTKTDEKTSSLSDTEAIIRAGLSHPRALIFKNPSLSVSAVAPLRAVKRSTAQRLGPLLSAWIDGACVFEDYSGSPSTVLPLIPLTLTFSLFCFFFAPKGAGVSSGLRFSGVRIRRRAFGANKAIRPSTPLGPRGCDPRFHRQIFPVGPTRPSKRTCSPHITSRLLSMFLRMWREHSPCVAPLHRHKEHHPGLEEGSFASPVQGGAGLGKSRGQRLMCWDVTWPRASARHNWAHRPGYGFWTPRGPPSGSVFPGADPQARQTGLPPAGPFSRVSLKRDPAFAVSGIKDRWSTPCCRSPPRFFGATSRRRLVVGKT